MKSSKMMMTKNKKVVVKAEASLTTSPMCCLSSTVIRRCGGFTFNHTSEACGFSCRETFMLATDEAVSLALSECM